MIKNKRRLKELDLMQFGHTIQLSGAIYTSEQTGEQFLIQFPDEAELDNATVLDMTPQDWQDLLAQTDKMEVEILTQAKDGTITKAITRKCTRQIETGVSWKVFKRDNYACRYCNNNSVPMTVDHLVLWEEGGPSIEANLVTACRKCNKARGNTQYIDWLNSAFYQKVSQPLNHIQKADNALLVTTLRDIPRKYNIASR